MLPTTTRFDRTGKLQRAEDSSAAHTVTQRTRAPRPLGKIKPGSGIKGASADSGSIGGFLINQKREIFLFSDAHVLTQKLNTAIDKVTPDSFTNKVIVKEVAIGAVVCSCQIQVHGHQNYDMALWVNENGGAVGIQVIVQSEIAVIHPMALVMAYFHRHYDGSLRFLTPNDLS